MSEVLLLDSPRIYLQWRGGLIRFRRGPRQVLRPCGRTYEGSRTVCGVLGPAAVIDECCGHLKLL